jgi:hypothetical protein
MHAPSDMVHGLQSARQYNAVVATTVSFFPLTYDPQPTVAVAVASRLLVSLWRVSKLPNSEELSSKIVAMARPKCKYISSICSVPPLQAGDGQHGASASNDSASLARGSPLTLAIGGGDGSLCLMQCVEQQGCQGDLAHDQQVRPAADAGDATGAVSCIQCMRGAFQDIAVMYSVGRSVFIWRQNKGMSGRSDGGDTREGNVRSAERLCCGASVKIGGMRGTVTALSVSGGGRYLYACCTRGDVTAWDLGTENMQVCVSVLGMYIV